jgi:hypothetical protein
MPEEVDVFNLEEHKKKLTEEQRRTRRRDINDVRKILKTPEGRRFIWRLWSICGLFRNPFHPNSNQHSLNSGRMSIGQEILIDVNDANVSAFAQMQQEYISALKSKKEAKENG